MEDYNETTNHGTRFNPIIKHRLFVTKAMYGYRLTDRKVKKTLLTFKTKEECEKGMELLRSGDIDGFNAFKDEIKDKVVFENKIIIFKEKYDDEIFLINSMAQLKRVALKMLNRRVKSQDISPWDKPEDLGFDHETIEQMPVSLRIQATRQLETFKRNEKQVIENNNLHDSALKAIEEENGGLAWSILQLRGGLQYEEYEIIEPQDI